MGVGLGVFLLCVAEESSQRIEVPLGCSADLPAGAPRLFFFPFYSHVSFL